MNLLLKFFSIVCYIELRYCYDFKASGTVDLTKDNGWSQFAAFCVGYLDHESSNFSVNEAASGTINIEFTAPNDAPNNTNYVLVAYDDQNISFPKVNNSYLSCNEKVDGPYKRLELQIRLEPSNTWIRTIQIHQHIKTRWWYFYLVNCNESLTFAPITYIYSYKDNPNDTKICLKPAVTTTTISPISTTPGSTTPASVTSNSTTDNILEWAFIGMIVIVIIGLCITFSSNYKRKKQTKLSQQKQNLLMDSLNEKYIPANKDAYNLLKKWSLEQYGKVLINEKGYDGLEMWKDLNEHDLMQMGFKEGHAKKFVKMVKERVIFMEIDIIDKAGNNDDAITYDLIYDSEENEGKLEGYINQ